MKSQETLRHVAYCGLFCGLCAQRSRIPQQARQLRKSLHEEGYDDWYQYVPHIKDSFLPFWQFLQRLAESDCTCRTGGGPPDCRIRECAKLKEIDDCTECKEYPCKLIQDLAEHYPTLIQDGKRLREIGLEGWLREQEERVSRGVVYADIRCPRNERV